MKDPIQMFAECFESAKHTEPEPTAMTLATVNAKGVPSARTVLLKAFDERGFVFYTNKRSRKAKDLEQNAYAALCFFWPSLDKQIRIEGSVEHVTDKEADLYFASRERLSQIGAWASRQSESLETMDILEDELQRLEKQFADKVVPRPPHWGGYRVRPQTLEFWTRGNYRLHTRELFHKIDGMWQQSWLYP